MTSVTPAARSSATSSARQQMRLAEAPVAGIGRMREDRALRIGDRDRPELHAASSFLRRAGAARPQRLDDLGQHRHRDLGRAGRADVQADRRMDAVDLVGRQRPAPAAARRAWRASSGCPARRHRSSRRRARPSARNRRSSDHASARQAPCSCRAAASSARPPAIRHAARTSGKRSCVANAVRGSMISMSKPAILAIGASAWLIWTAPITTSRGCGHMHVEEEVAALRLDRTGIAGAEAAWRSPRRARRRPGRPPRRRGRGRRRDR